MKIKWLLRTVIMIIGLFFVFTLAEAGTYTDNKDGTITDADTSLMWQKSDDGVERTWDNAAAYCTDLKLAGHEDWVLPQIQMLEHLIDNSFSPTVNPIFSVRLSYYWSATESRESINSAKYINFFYGNTYSFIKDNTYYAICARDISAGQIDSMQVKVESEVVSSSAPFTVQFSSIISGGTEPYFFEWDFNDGEFSSLSNPQHIFKEDGPYPVVVTVTDNDGAAAVGRQALLLPSASAPTPDVPTLGGEEKPVDHFPEDVGVMGGNETLETQVVEVVKTLDDSSAPVISTASTKEVAIPVLITEVPGVLEGETIAEDNSTIEAMTDDLGEDGNATLLNDDVFSGGDSNGDGDDLGDILASDHGSLKIFVSNNSDFTQMASIKNGLLVYSFINGLRGDADWNKDSKVTARELKGYLGSAIDNLSQGKQKSVINMSDEDFPICSEEGVTHVLAVGVDDVGAGGVDIMPFAAQGAKDFAMVVSEKCPSWKQLVLTGKETARNNIIRAILKMRRDAGPQDNFIFYYASPSIGSEQGLNLFTYDALPDLPGMTALDYDDLVGLIEESDAANSIMLFDLAPHDHD